MLCAPAFYYTHADYQALSVYVADIDWLALFVSVSSSDVNAVWLLFEQEIAKAISLHLLLKCARRSSRVRKYPSFIRRALKRKQVLWCSRHLISGLTRFNQLAEKCAKIINKFSCAC